MQMLSQPRIVAARSGQTWLPAGFRLFHRQPLAWTLILFVYWASMLIMAFIPMLGSVLPLLIAPGLSMGFIEIARAVDEGRPPSPPLLVSAFRSPRAKAVLMLGVWYALEIVAILLFSVMIDGGLLLDWITSASMPGPEKIGDMQRAAAVSVLLYVPVMMSFWFAPQLVVWSGFSPLKALFFSFFAVWRNLGAFLRYALIWVLITVGIALLSSLIGSGLDLGGETMTAFLFPITLILMAVAHGSFYQSTRDIFGVSDQEPSPAADDAAP